ncbi:MAG: GNAT family N-acetyltransferase [Vicinamibacteria bacterium]
MIHLAAGTAVVREWRRDDAAALVPQANDERVAANMRDAFPHPYGLEDAERFIALALEKSPPTFLAIEVSGRIAGGIGYTLHTDVERVGAEVGYWLGHEFWGRGIGTAALRALTNHAFRTHQELRRLYAVPFAWNPGSARVLQKVGYRCEGTLRQSAIKNGQVLDQWMYAILREEWLRRDGYSS